MRIIIAGSRTFCDYEFLERKCDYLLQNIRCSIEIVSGTADGADKLGEFYAEQHGYAIKRFPADWDTFGKAAGPMRNREMAVYVHKHSNPLGGCIVFWDGKSRGSHDMIEKAHEYKLKLKVIKFKLVKAKK